MILDQFGRTIQSPERAARSEAFGRAVSSVTSCYSERIAERIRGDHEKWLRLMGGRLYDPLGNRVTPKVAV